jgi:hypothetical protein
MEPELKSLEPYVVVDGDVLDARDGTVLHEPLDPSPPPRMVHQFLFTTMESIIKRSRKPLKKWSLSIVAVKSH